MVGSLPPLVFASKVQLTFLFTGSFFLSLYIQSVFIYKFIYIYAWEPPYTVVEREDVEQLELGNI